ncbi:helix-turn-helix domain-containing protein [Emticicia fontis]
MISNQYVIVDNIQRIIDEKGINVAELSRISNIEYTSLSTIMRKKRRIGDALLLRISKALNINIEELKKEQEGKPLQTDTYKSVDDRISTLEESMVKALELTGETPEFKIYKKLEYLLVLGEMKEKGQLTEDEFIKIKTKLIALM